MSDLVKNIFRLAIFILVQVFVLNKIPHLHQFVVPYLYYLFILWLPFTIPRMGLLGIGFITGLLLDYFMMTPGLHTAACVLIAYVRPFLINLMIVKDTSELTYHEPSPRGMGWGPYFIYVFILTLLHHIYLVFLQWLDFGTFLTFLIKVGATTGISMLLILTVELLFPRRLKYRTNTA
ncbi:rod shape-determining protein MreD [Flavisolibacter tropicus]|uniref:Rod shape-determining protein MreD n=1 Tax=Flavisolibacter tropicus TaxID=1492898 RepID=A0A172TYZ4_9BACT|nr:rod shape-determining protein MreD [Flavisolibacter tropicus]ANE52094.1 rod shape-determining protein MreD [Flavisolibacter tropicus]